MLIVLISFFIVFVYPILVNSNCVDEIKTFIQGLIQKALKGIL